MLVKWQANPEQYIGCAVFCMRKEGKQNICSHCVHSHANWKDRKEANKSDVTCCFESPS